MHACTYQTVCRQKLFAMGNCCMSLDQVRVRYTRSWLEKSHNDIRVAVVLLAADPPLLDEISFHCQQSIEKSMKGFLFWHGVHFQKTHDLSVLGVACASL